MERENVLTVQDKQLPLIGSKNFGLMSAPFRLGLQSGVDDGLDPCRIVGGFPAPAWRNLTECRDTSVAEALSP